MKFQSFSKRRRRDRGRKNKWLDSRDEKKKHQLAKIDSLKTTIKGEKARKEKVMDFHISGMLRPVWWINMLNRLKNLFNNLWRASGSKPTEKN